MARAVGDDARRAIETSKRSADEHARALRETQDKAERLAAELAAVRKEADTQIAAERAANDRIGRALATTKRSADEQAQALRMSQDQAEKLGLELAGAGQVIQSHVAEASLMKDQVANLQAAAERSAEEQRRALKQEREKTEKIAAELAEARSRLEMQAKARAAEEVLRDNVLVAMRQELQQAKAEAIAARETLEVERNRAQRAELQLATVQENTVDRSRRVPPAESSPVTQPAIPRNSAPKAPTKSAASPGLDHSQPLRLIERAELLLEQGNIGAARNMFDRAAELGSTEALFWLAETYDPLILSMRQTVGTKSDVAKARELYGRALAAGMSQASARLEALQQRAAADDEMQPRVGSDR